MTLADVLALVSDFVRTDNDVSRQALADALEEVGDTEAAATLRGRRLRVYVVWGSAERLRDAYGENASYDDLVEEYGFSTCGEERVFLMALTEADGFSDSFVGESREEAKEYVIDRVG